MAPKVSAADAKAYVEAISRIADMLSLASMVPVLFECRFGSKLQSMPPPPEATPSDKETEKEETPAKAGKHAKKKASEAQAGQEADKQKDVQEKEKGKEKDSSWPVLPLGLPSLLLFVASELAACSSLLVPAPRKGKAKAEGSAMVLLEAVKREVHRLQGTSKTSKMKGGQDVLNTSQKVIHIVMESLSEVAAFDAAHAFVMLLALFAIFVSLVGQSGPALLCKLASGSATHRAAILAAVPLIAFVALQGPLLAKVWKAIQSEQLLPAMRLPLRAAAILAAGAPMSGEAPNLPIFAVMQVASLAATISAEISSGHLNVPALVKAGLPKALLDASALSVLLPILLAVVWLCCMHLRHDYVNLTLAASISVISSPALLMTGWRLSAPHLGLAADGAAGLVKVLSLLYALLSTSLVMAGGTLTIMSLMLLGNLLVRLHGEEAFTGLIF